MTMRRLPAAIERDADGFERVVVMPIIAREGEAFDVAGKTREDSDLGDGFIDVYPGDTFAGLSYFDVRETAKRVGYIVVEDSRPAEKRRK